MLYSLRNYLRVRGEYAWLSPWPAHGWELPPRARRILANDTASLPNAGTTSACAENTRLHKDTIRDLRNYLRVRGEYLALQSTVSTGVELPPRARRIPVLTWKPPTQGGTTSACAENTGQTIFSTPPWWNYLRVRGEYPNQSSVALKNRELPPRARRIHHP